MLQTVTIDVLSEHLVVEHSEWMKRGSRDKPSSPCPGGRRPVAGSLSGGRRRWATETGGATETRTDRRHTTATTTQLPIGATAPSTSPDPPRFYHPVRVGRQAADPLPVLRSSAALKRDERPAAKTSKLMCSMSGCERGGAYETTSPRTCRPRCSEPTEPSGCLRVTTLVMKRSHFLSEGGPCRGVHSPQILTAPSSPPDRISASRSRTLTQCT